MAEDKNMDLSGTIDIIKCRNEHRRYLKENLARGQATKESYTYCQEDSGSMSS
jgi:hypothetical protein